MDLLFIIDTLNIDRIFSVGFIMLICGLNVDMSYLIVNGSGVSSRYQMVYVGHV